MNLKNESFLIFETGGSIVQEYSFGFDQKYNNSQITSFDAEEATPLIQNKDWT